MTPHQFTTKSNRLLIVSMGLAAAAAIAMYAPALRFGFFNDDPTGHLRWMEGRSILSFFVDASGHGYYRPISFALWQALYVLTGRHDAPTLHALNLAAHALNAALVCWLTFHFPSPFPLRRLPSLACSLAASLLFALYPFSYEAVPYVGSFVHPLVTLFILLALTFYLIWRSNGGWGWFMAAHLALALAGFTHENGIIAPLLIMALEFFERRSAHVGPRSVFYTLSFLVEPALTGFIWLLVPKSVEAGRTPTFAALAANLLPFVQALTYPVAPLARRDVTWLVVIAGVALIGLCLLAWALKQVRLLAFGVWFWLLAALPSMLLLDPPYVRGSPRLFYLGSVGAALVWALPVHITNCKFKISNHVSRISNRISHAALYVLLLALYLVPNAHYLIPYAVCQLRYQGYAGQVGQMMAAATRQVEEESSITFVNLPCFFGSRGPGTECPQPFAFAPTGAVVLPPYADARDFALYNGGRAVAARAVTVNEYAPGWATHGPPINASELRAALASSRVFVFDLLDWQLHDLSALWQVDSPHLAAPPTAILGGVIRLGQCDISNLESEIVVTLTWQAIAAPRHDYTVFTQLLDEEGWLAAQHDAPPARGLAPTRLWQEGDQIVDVHRLPLPAGWPRGAGRIIVGMYDPITGARLEAFEPEGARLPDDAISVWP